VPWWPELHKSRAPLGLGLGGNTQVSSDTEQDHGFRRDVAAFPGPITRHITSTELG
jgi:hypothetical protein